MSAPVWDAVVVGSGPAGCCAAYHLAAAGARTLIVERMRLPRYKTCGGGLVGRTLQRLPPGLALRPERVLRAVELRLAEPGLRYVVRRTTPVVTMTMRADFDLRLLRAAEAAGAEICPECEVLRIDDDGEHVRVGTRRGTFRARFVIGADGVAGPVARLAGWQGAPYGIPALECELQVDGATLERFTETARFDVGQPDDGYAWIFPKREHLSVGILRMRRGASGLKRELRRYLGRCGIDPGSAPHVRGYQIPVRPRADGFGRGRVLLAGDAAGLADPVTAEGISYAVHSGRLAATAVLEGDAGRVRAAYARSLRREILPELRTGRILSRLLYRHRGLRRLAFRRAGQPLCEALTDVFLGQRTYRELLARPGSYLKQFLRGRFC